MNLLPWDSLKALHNPSGIRLAVHEVTRWGMGQAQMRRVGQLFAEVLLGSRRPDQVCPEVVALKSEFDTIQYCFN